MLEKNKNRSDTGKSVCTMTYFLAYFAAARLFTPYDLLCLHSKPGHDMVLIGIGVLLVSISFFIYKQPSWTWLPILNALKREDKEKAGREDGSSQVSGDEKRKEHGLNVSVIRSNIEKGISDSFQDTPKAVPFILKEASSIPSFELNDWDKTGTTATNYGLDGGEDQDDHFQNAIVNTPKQLSSGVPGSPRSSMAPPPRPTTTAKRKPTSTVTNLVPPPFRPLPTSSLTHRPPPSIASTLRAPPSRSLAPPTSCLAPSTSTLSPSSRPSKKVLLSPGHSPLDWAHLTAHPPTPTFLRGANVPPQLIRVTPSLLRHHNGRKGKDAWGVWQGKVYNLSPYMYFHPGGVDQLMRGAGREKDGENLFLEVHPWVSWEAMLGECLVGILVSEEEGKGVSAGNGLEEMD